MKTESNKQQRINETKEQFFEKLNKINKPLKAKRQKKAKRYKLSI